MIDDEGARPRSPGILPLHFDVAANYLPLRTFTQTAQQTELIIAAFNRELFGSQVTYELLVLPPDGGTFKGPDFYVVLLAGWGVIWSFTESDVGKAFIKGLTKYEPAHWSEEVGAYLRAKLVVAEDDAKTKQDFATKVVVEMTKSFLQANEQQIQSAGISKENFRDAFEARNKFFQACIDDVEVRAIGFDKSARFPIKRRDFVELQVALPAKEAHVAVLPWEVDIK